MAQLIEAAFLTVIWGAVGVALAWMFGTPERACRMAFEITRARAHPDAVFRDVECKPMEGKK